MRTFMRAAEGWAVSTRAVVAGSLCVMMAGQPLLSAEFAAKKTITTPQIVNEQRVLHALNRLTFGPRPGEVQAVQAMGLQRWFEQQLNPASTDAALEERLAMFPAMKMSQAELIERYPSPQVLRQMIQKNEPLPSDPMLHAIYADQIAFYKMAKERKEAVTTANATAGLNAGQGMDADKSVKRKVAKGVDLLGDEGMSRRKGDDSMSMEAGMVALPRDSADISTNAKMHEERFFSGLESGKILNLPPDERMQRLLSMNPTELIALRQSMSRSERTAIGAGLSPLQKETLAALQSSPRLIGGEVLQTRLLRDIYSDCQLEAVMTDFWLNHFNIYMKKNQNEPYFLPSFERDVIRPNALGMFEDLLVGTAKSPAMLMYLDNWQSVGPDSQAAKNGRRFAGMAKNPQVKQAMKNRGLNENYARELMELHTIGVQCEVSKDRPATMLSAACGQGYTQQDVTQVAKVLSGWTIDKPYRGGEFQFDERRHEPGSKTVLGTVVRQAGEKEGLDVLHMLATSPATAQFISNKLAVRFVSDTPPTTLVDRMAKSFVASGGDMKTVLRTMFQSPEFWAPSVYRAKVKTPLEFVASAVRASGAEVGNAAALVQSLDRLGMPLYGMQTPNGYSWLAEPWVSTSALVNRMNFALVLSGNRLAGTKTDWTGVLGGERPSKSLRKAASLESTESEPAVRTAAKEKKLEEVLLGQPVSDRTRQAVLRQSTDTTAQEEAEKNFVIQTAESGAAMDVAAGKAQAAAGDSQAAMMAGLLLGSPEFQRR